MTQVFYKYECLIMGNSWTAFLVWHHRAGDAKKEKNGFCCPLVHGAGRTQIPERGTEQRCLLLLQQAVGSGTGHVLQVFFAIWLLHMCLPDLQKQTDHLLLTDQEVSHCGKLFLKYHLLWSLQRLLRERISHL